MNEEKVTLMIDKIVWEKFRRYCAANAFKISGKIQLLLEEEIERGPKTKTLVEVFQEIIDKERGISDSEKTEEEQRSDAEDEPKDDSSNAMIETKSSTVGPIVVAEQTADDPKMVRNKGKIPTIDELRLKKDSEIKEGNSSC